MSFAEEMAALESEIFKAIEGAQDEAHLEEVRVGVLGKKGSLSGLMRGLAGLSGEEKRERGGLLNTLKERVQGALDGRRSVLRERDLERRLASQWSDPTLDGEDRGMGTLHPVMRVWEEVVHIFGELGFFLGEGPHIETEWYNFEALNIPSHHPARQEHDTFYFGGVMEDGERHVLRTHTSPVQIRTLKTHGLPLRMIAPGRTFRCDSDQTHTPMFHQVEGLVVEEGVHLGHLKWCLEAFCRAFFEVDEVKMRFRPSYFPFTEPSMEVDVACSFQDGQVVIGEGERWLEILGSGMVHPKVFEAVGVDHGKYQGFAFGVGLDRLAMLKYGIPDLRAFFESDLRWIRHYGFSPLKTPTLVGGLS